MTLKIHLEYVRICVSQHILYIWPYMYVVNNKLEGGGGGAKVYTFGKVSSLGVQKFHHQSHRSYKKKVIVAEV